ncbi:MAG TPA: DUF2207 domain-containing protein, partial [Acidimicrobiales bacterium]|nr:DUF2207 domain-containing protein [Acidimicrobiales bacterium]
MRTSSRRKLDIGLLIGGSVVLAGGAMLGSAAGNQERVTRFWTGAVVAADGSAQVSEAIDWEFGISQKHGIFRDVPGVDPGAPITVSSPDAPDQAEIGFSPVLDGTRIKIGDPDTTITGRHLYRIDYPLPGVVQDGRLDWETTGTGWPVGMDEIEIHLVTPFTLDAGICSVGGTGATGGCELTQVEPGHVVVRVDSVGAHESVSVEGNVGAPLPTAPAAPAPPADPPDEPGTGILPPGGTAAAGALVAAVPMGVLVRRAGRERVAAGGAADAP